MFEKTFCSGPWFHIGINYDGSYAKCRWAKDAFNKNKNYKSIKRVKKWKNQFSFLPIPLLATAAKGL